MKTSPASLANSGQPLETPGHSTKMISLLALAAGAAAMPQSSNADIIVRFLDANPEKVGFSDGYNVSYEMILPGAIQFGFARHSTFKSAYGGPPFLVQSITLGRQTDPPYWNAGAQATTGGAIAVLDEDDPWSGKPGSALVPLIKATVGARTTQTPDFSPAAYDHRYIAFLFVDTTQGPMAVRYGWAEVSLAIGPTLGPDLLIHKYAYNDTGGTILMGEIPEPAPISLLALGALTMGAKGVRAWRRSQRGAKAS